MKVIAISIANFPGRWFTILFAYNIVVVERFPFKFAIIILGKIFSIVFSDS